MRTNKKITSNYLMYGDITFPKLKPGNIVLNSKGQLVTKEESTQTSGTVTSVGVSVSGGLTSSGGPITESGIINIGVNSNSEIPLATLMNDLRALLVDYDNYTQATDSEISTLKAKVTDLENANASLNTSISDLEARVNTLENPE